jgi:hypothetical protein
VVGKTEGQGDEDGASQDMQGIHSNFGITFWTISDNVLTVGESAKGEEQAGRLHPHSGGLLEGAGECVDIARRWTSLRRPSGDTDAARSACRSTVIIF